MERALKERLVGAVVIVVLGVLVIPALLDGPEESGQVVEQGLVLPAESPGMRTVTIPVGQPDAAPVPVPAPPAADPVAPRPDAGTVQRPPEAGPAPAAEAPARPKSSPSSSPAPARSAAKPGEWAVQVGSFAQTENAERLRARLLADGFSAFTSRIVTDAGTMHRVRVGPVASREEAERLLERLTRAGQAGRVVRAED